MSRAASPFSPRAVLAMLVVGTGAFLLALYAVGAGWDAGVRNGGAHAGGNGLNGFSGLVELLEKRGYQVSLSRTRARLRWTGLLVMTPEPAAKSEDINDAIAARRHIGPTLVIVPKWRAGQVPRGANVNTRRGWVLLAGTGTPDWLDDLPGLTGAKAVIAHRDRWEGMGLSGSFPDARQVAAIEANRISSVVRDGGGRTLAGFLPDAENLGSQRQWPVMLVVEPDLLDNYGLADLSRAREAVQIVEAAAEADHLPVTFDLTLAGLGQSKNLLTLAFEPPFLAATLCLLLAALVVAWRSLRRFGPPLAEAPALALGKRRLARNGAGLIERSKRLHLLGPPYAALIAERIAARLGIRENRAELRDQVAAGVLAARGIADDYQARLGALRGARRSADLLRAAGALKAIERTLAP